MSGAPDVQSFTKGHQARSVSSRGRSYLKRVVVVGVSGSWKTTMGAGLAEKLGVPHVELDALNWESNLEMAPDEVFRERVSSAI